MPKYGTDYTKSAIDLKNPLEVRDLLLAYGKAKDLMTIAAVAFTVATKDIPEMERVAEATLIADKAMTALKEAIGRCGSYQDIAEGLYALKQSRTGVTYNVGMVRELIPQFAQAVITETVDGVKLHGLAKGGLITDADLSRMEVRTELSPAYIIDVATKTGGSQ